jgi:thiol-disulfide isomerase/thioredoxin
MNRPSATLVALVCLSGAAGFGVYRGVQWWSARPVDAMQWSAPLADTASGRAGVRPAPAGTDGAETDPAPAAGDPPATPVPDEVPDLTLPDLQGQRHSLRSYRGKPVIYNFWASWCVPCRREIPLLNQLQRQAVDNSLYVVGIAADLRENVVEFTKSTRMDYALLIGEQEGAEAAQRFGVPLVLPFSVFVASDGRVVALKLGELHQDEATAMLATIRRLDQGKVSLAEARSLIAERMKELAVERAKQANTSG